MNKRSHVKVTVGVLALVITVLVAGFVHRMMQPVIFNKQKMESYGAIIYDKPRIFRDIQLLGHDKKPFTKAAFVGKWTFVFFGFTSCPDVCPTTMGVLNKLYKELQGKHESDDFQVVLVTVDPARDTPEKLREYVTYFNPLFMGVTGDYMDLVKFSADLNAGFTKVPLPDGNYTMEHSGDIAVINPRGDYHGLFRPPFDPLRLRLAFDSMREQYKRDYGK